MAFDPSSLLTATGGASPGLTLATSLLGIGVSMLGNRKQVAAAKQTAAAQGQIFQDQQAEDEVRRQAMSLDAYRNQLETARNAQRARSMALTAATGQSAAQGSGLQGGYGQISGDANTSLAGIDTNLMFGNKLFDINKDINAQHQVMATASGNAATGMGMNSLGQSIAGSASILGKIGPSFGNMFKTSSNSGMEYLTQMQNA